MKRIIPVSLLLIFSNTAANPLLAKGAYILGDHIKSTAVFLAMTTLGYQEIRPLAERAIPYGKIIFHPITPIACYATGSALKASGISSKYPQQTGMNRKLYAIAKDSCQDIFALKKSLLVMGIGQLLLIRLRKQLQLPLRIATAPAAIITAASLGLFVAEKKVDNYLENKLKEASKEQSKK